MEVPWTTIVIETVEGKVEIKAQVRASGLAVHEEEQRVWEHHDDDGNDESGQPRYIARHVTTTAAITHVASGRRLLSALDLERASEVAQALEATNIDWTKPGDEVKDVAREVVGFAGLLAHERCRIPALTLLAH